MAAVAAAAVLAISGCSGEAPTTAPEAPSAPATSAPANSAPATSASPTASQTPVTTPSASATPSAKRSTAPASKKVTAGTVTNRKSASVSGSGPADIRFTTKGEFAVVVRVDCSRCTGDFTLTAPERMSPLGKNKAPLKASYLVSVLKEDSDKQSLLLNATGRWKVNLVSWNNLPIVKGKQTGKGSTVLFLGDKVSRLKVSYKPSGKGDSFDARIFTVSDKPLIFGDTDPFTETQKVDLPGVIAISTNGSWTLTPK